MTTRDWHRRSNDWRRKTPSFKHRNTSALRSSTNRARLSIRCKRQTGLKQSTIWKQSKSTIRLSSRYSRRSDSMSRFRPLCTDSRSWRRASTSQTSANARARRWLSRWSTIYRTSRSLWATRSPSLSSNRLGTSPTAPTPKNSSSRARRKAERILSQTRDC